MSHRSLLTIAALSALAATSSATVTFDNFFSNADGVTAGFGASPTINANALTYLPTGADVGEFSTGNLLTITFGYDASSTSPISSTTSLAQTSTSGSGSVSFTQNVFAVDSLGNQGALLGTASTTTDAGGNLPFTNLILTSPSGKVRVVNTFVLTATDTADTDYATIGLVNQSVQAVPEPASMAALGLGVLAFARKKRR